MSVVTEHLEQRGCAFEVFAAGSQTESVRMRTGELFGSEQATTVPLVKRPERASEDPIA